MSIQHLFDAELWYVTDMPPVVSPDGREGELLGSGEGTVEGPRIRGRVRFSFFEEGCPLDPGFLQAPADVKLAEGDYLCKTNPGAIIETDDGATILVDAIGFALRREERAPIWKVASSIRFVTDDARYRWMNDALAVYEGEFNERTGRANWRAYGSAPAIQVEAA